MPTEHDKAVERLLQTVPTRIGGGRGEGPLPLTLPPVSHDSDYHIRKAETKRERKRRARINPRA